MIGTPHIKHHFPGWIQGFIHLFYPRVCEGCHTPLHKGEELLCLACAQQIKRTGYHHLPDNDTALRFAGRIPFVHATSLAYFHTDGLLQQLIHGLKYRNRKENGIYLGKELAQAIKDEQWAIDYIIPIPIHRKKERKRGYNQSAIIAEGMGCVLSIPVLSHIIIRTRNTESQTDKNREERIQNVAEAFELTENNLLINKHVLLIDDVLTTGATIEACCAAIADVPGIKLSIATIGIAG